VKSLSKTRGMKNVKGRKTCWKLEKWLSIVKLVKREKREDRGSVSCEADWEPRVTVIVPSGFQHCMERRWETMWLPQNKICLRLKPMRCLSQRKQNFNPW
jgi:hypothetical protein